MLASWWCFVALEIWMLAIIVIVHVGGVEDHDFFALFVCWRPIFIAVAREVWFNIWLTFSFSCIFNTITVVFHTECARKPGTQTSYRCRTHYWWQKQCDMQIDLFLLQSCASAIEDHLQAIIRAKNSGHNADTAGWTVLRWPLYKFQLSLWIPTDEE